MGAASRFAGDALSSRNAVGTAVRRLLKGRGAIRIAAPYVSGDPRQLVGLPEARWKSLTLICNIESGNCDPLTLRKLLDGGATIFTSAGLHAKVYICDAGVAVASANFTPNGLGAGTIETAAILTDSTTRKAASEWFDKLQRHSANVAAQLRDTDEFVRLLSIWKTRQGGFNGRVPAHESRNKSSLLRAIELNLPSLKDVTFSWYSGEPDLSTATVSRAARKRGIPIPSDSSDWTWFESLYKRGLSGRMRRVCRSKPQIAWCVEMDSDGRIEKFMAHDDYASPFYDAVDVGGWVVSLVSTHPTPTPFNLRTDRRELAGILTRGITRSSTKLRQKIENDLSIISVAQLRQLVKLGTRP